MIFGGVFMKALSCALSAIFALAALIIAITSFGVDTLVFGVGSRRPQTITGLLGELIDACLPGPFVRNVTDFF